MVAVMSFVTDASGHRSVAFSLIKRVPVLRSATSAASTAKDGGGIVPNAEKAESATEPNGTTEAIFTFWAMDGAAGDPPVTAPTLASPPSEFINDEDDVTVSTRNRH